MEMTDEQAWREQAELENERRIQAWLREQTGLEPATGDYAMALMSLQSEAVELIKNIELELSGIRNGGPRWHGADVIGGQLRLTVELCNRILERLRQEGRPWEEQEAPF